MAVIKSVQRGTATISASAASTTATVTAVDETKTILVFGLSKAKGDQPDEDFIRGHFTSTTELTFDRTGTTGAAVTIEWYVVEWSSGVTVQSGIASGTAGEDTTITAVVIADSFVLNTWHKDGSTMGDDDLIKARLSTTTNLEIRDNGGGLAGGINVAWFVVESTDFTTQEGSANMASGLTTDITVTEVDLAKAFPLLSFSTNGSPGLTEDVMLRGHFTTTTNLRVERDTDGPVDPGTGGIRFQVIEIDDGSSVQSGTFAFADTDGQESATVTAVTDGMPIASGFQHRGGQGSGTTDTPNPAEATFDLTTSTNLQADRGSTGGTADIEWFLIDWGKVFTDDFNRSDEALAVSSNWVDATFLGDAGAFQIVSNQAEPDPGDLQSWALVADDTFDNDQFAQGICTGFSDESIGVLLRADDADNDSYMGYWRGQGNFWRIAKIDNDSFSVLEFAAAPSSITDVKIRLEVRGTSLELFVDDVSTLTATDSALTGGRIGIFGEDIASDEPDMDDFEGGNLAVAGGLTTTLIAVGDA